MKFSAGCMDFGEGRQAQGIVGFCILLVAIVGHLAVLKTWWFHDDWVFLADAAGIADRGGGWARWLSYKGYWHALYPLFGLEPLGWGISRLLLHFASSVMVARICRHAGLSPTGQWAGGLVFASSSVAFESLYWGTGAIELLGVFWTFWAIERWLAGGRRNRLIATLLCVAAILSKESGLLVPLYFAAHLLVKRKSDPWIWGALGAVAVVGVLAVLQLKADFAHDTDYALSLAGVPRNLLALGFWLIAPPPWQMGWEWMRFWPLTIGGVFWAGWVAVAWAQHRKGNPLFLVVLGVVLLSLLPAAMLDTHILPRYAYGAVAGVAICLAGLIRKRWASLPVWGFAVGTIIVAFATWGATEIAIKNRHSGGRPAHRLVLKEELSRKTCRGIEKLGEKDFDHLVFLIDPAGDKEQTQLLRDSIGDTLGPRMMLGEGVRVEWTDELSPAQAGAIIVSVKGLNLKTLGYYSP